MIWILAIVSVAFFNLGNSLPTTTVPEDVNIPAEHFKDIIAIIPQELIKNITYQHLESDEGFKSAVKFMQTEEWNARVKALREKPEWVALKKYLKGFGINLDTLIKCVHGFVQNVTVTSAEGAAPAKKSVKAFLIHVEENLPTMKILTALHEKMMHDVKLQNLFDKISGTDTRKMIDNVLTLPEIKNMLKDFADMDLNFVDALSLMYAFLGWGQLKTE